MKVLVFGQTGQVACELFRRCPPHVDVTLLGRAEADLSHPERCAEAIAGMRPDAVINAAAWTAVDKAEADEAGAITVNSEAPGAMARSSARLGIPFLHLSTDYIFDGEGARPFLPDSRPAPLGAYGRSKLAGEHAVRNAGGQHLILRTSWIVSAYGANFVKTMLRLGQEQKKLRVVADQVGGPTPAAAIADALYSVAGSLAAGHAGGTHHFAGTPDTNWADFARTIMEAARIACTIEDIPSSAYPTPARRPLNSRLDCTSFEWEFGISRPDWRAGLDDILKDLGVVS